MAEQIKKNSKIKLSKSHNGLDVVGIHDHLRPEGRLYIGNKVKPLVLAITLICEIYN